jgi:transposase InsO family protein
MRLKPRIYINAPPLFLGFFKEVGKQLRFEYIRNHAEAGEITMYCRVLKVTPQGYKKYLKNLSRPYKYAQLLAAMRAILEEDQYNKTYGKQRMFEKLQLDYECPHCYNTVAKVMRENGMLQSPNKPKGLTKADKDAQKSDNLLNRDFTAEAPNEKTVTDITEMEACDGKLYISATFDCFDNACLSVAMADHMRKELVVETVKQAAMNYDLRGAISHSDRGSQYTSEDYRSTLDNLGITQSMNSAAGRCHDNAMCESMWARAKHEITACYNTKKMTREQLKTLVIDYFLNYWNYRRICSAIGGMPPLIKRGAYYEMQADKAMKSTFCKQQTA